MRACSTVVLAWLIPDTRAQFNVSIRSLIMSSCLALAFTRLSMEHRKGLTELKIEGRRHGKGIWRSGEENEESLFPIPSLGIVF